MQEKAYRLRLFYRQQLVEKEAYKKCKYFAKAQQWCNNLIMQSVAIPTCFALQKCLFCTAKSAYIAMQNNRFWNVKPILQTFSCTFFTKQAHNFEVSFIKEADYKSFSANQQQQP